MATETICAVRYQIMKYCTNFHMGCLRGVAKWTQCLGQIALLFDYQDKMNSESYISTNEEP